MVLVIANTILLALYEKYKITIEENTVFSRAAFVNEKCVPSRYKCLNYVRIVRVFVDLKLVWKLIDT